MNPNFFESIHASGKTNYIIISIIKKVRLGQASLSYNFKGKISAILNHIANGAAKSSKKYNR